VGILFQMWRFETAVRIEAGVVEYQVEIAVPEGSSGGVEVELRALGCRDSRGAAIVVGVEFENVVAVEIFSGFKLAKDVFVTVEKEIGRQCSGLTAPRRRSRVYARASVSMNGGR